MWEYSFYSSPIGACEVATGPSLDSNCEGSTVTSVDIIISSAAVGHTVVISCWAEWFCRSVFFFLSNLSVRAPEGHHRPGVPLHQEDQIKVLQQSLCPLPHLHPQTAQKNPPQNLQLLHGSERTQRTGSLPAVGGPDAPPILTVVTLPACQLTAMGDIGPEPGARVWGQSLGPEPGARARGQSLGSEPGASVQWGLHAWMLELLKFNPS